MNVLTLSAMRLGSFLAKAVDPVTWTVCAIGVWLALGRRDWFWVLLAAFIGATVVVFVVGSRAARAGVELNAAQEWLTQVALLAVWGSLVFGLTRLLRQLRTRRSEERRVGK